MVKEKHCLSDYIKKTYKESIYAPGTHVVNKIELICPACSTINIYLEHGDAGYCKSCKLIMQVYDNALFIWRDD